MRLRDPASKLMPVSVMVMVALALSPLVHAQQALVPARPVPCDGDARIAAVLARILSTYDVPALAGAVVHGRGLAAEAVVGWRRRGDPTPATVNDSWHIGSDTKAMTAAVAARLVERGLLHWDATLGSLLPHAPSQWRKVTLDQLLMHHAGLPANIPWHDCTDRLSVLDALALLQPLSEPGTAFLYSNVGYVLAGLMIEKAGGNTWEALIARELWQPLHMARAGFGCMGRPGKVDQPCGHTMAGLVVENGPDADNPPCMGPAGRVHLPLADWARFAADQIRGERGEPALLWPASYHHLHTPWPDASSYAPGWGIDTARAGHGIIMTHHGDNTMNHAVIVISPAADLAILVCCNQGGPEASSASSRACTAAVTAILALDIP